MKMKLRAALYGRHSVDNNERAASDQLRVCEEFAKRSGWSVVARYKDENISGGTSRRPAYREMCAAAARKEFDLVISEDLKRLWREPAEQWRCIQEWYDIGVCAKTVSGLDMADRNFKMLAATMGAAAEYERTECSYRIRRGLESNAIAKRPTGGRCFGYNAANGGKVTINKGEAAIVRRIFSEYVSGRSPRGIAHALNRDGVPSPGASWKRTSLDVCRDGKWRISGVRVILRNARYCGFVTWGASKVVRKASDSTRRTYLPGDKPRTHRDEKLRIIDDATFRAADRRIVQQRKESSGRGGRPMRHVLSGVLKCDGCGGSFIVSGGSYVCSTYRSAGVAACEVNQRVGRTHVEQAIFNGISEQLLAPDFLAAYSKWFRRTVDEAEKAQPDNSKRLRVAEREIENLVAVIAEHGMSGSRAMTDKLRKLEAERDQLATQMPSSAKVVSLLPRLKDRYETLLRSLPAMAAYDPDRARTLLLDLTGGLRLVREKDGLVAQADLTGERLAAFSGVALNRGAGGGT